MSNGIVSPLETRIRLLRSKRQQGYDKIGEVGSYELMPALTLASI